MRVAQHSLPHWLPECTHSWSQILCHPFAGRRPCFWFWPTSAFHRRIPGNLKKVVASCRRRPLRASIIGCVVSSLSAHAQGFGLCFEARSAWVPGVPPICQENRSFSQIYVSQCSGKWVLPSKRLSANRIPATIWWNLIGAWVAGMSSQAARRESSSLFWGGANQSLPQGMGEIPRSEA